MSQLVAMPSTNLALWQAAAKEAVQLLPVGLRFARRVDLVTAVRENDRVASALRQVELALIDSFVPVVRAEVEAGRIERVADDDYLKMSARFVSALVAEWLVLDLTDRNDQSDEVAGS